MSSATNRMHLAVGLVIAALVIIFVAATQSFHQCVQDVKHHSEYRGLYDEVSAFFRLFVKARLVTFCEGAAIDAHNGFLTVIATGVIAWFTISLTTATKGLQAAAAAQSVDMGKSIAEAARAADAMEGVAASFGENTKATREILENQKIFAAAQMRAYLAIIVGGFVPQDRDTNWRAEVRMIIKNSGHTPAHDVAFQMRAKILPLPLPDDFDVTLIVNQVSGAGHIPPGNQHFIRAWLDSLLSDDEIVEMKTSSDKALFVYGSVLYRDVFGINHHTNFCQHCVWDVKQNFNTFNASRHNDAD